MTYPAWIRELPKLGKPLPVLSFPSVSLTGAGVYDLTHDPAVPYAEYVERIAQNPIAAKVKTADLRHNLDARRLNGGKPKKQETYMEALAYLEKTKEQ